MNPYEPHDLIASCDHALEAWEKKSLEEKLSFFKKIGILNENGDIHSDYDWTPERYAREFSPQAAAK